MTVSPVGTAGVLALGTTSASPAWGTSQNRTAGNLLTAVVTNNSVNVIACSDGTWTAGPAYNAGSSPNVQTFYKDRLVI